MDYALITGASSGIGLELAGILAEKKHNLILVARREDILLDRKAAWEQQFGIHVETCALDLSLPGSAGGLHDFCTARGLRVGILVNNAGFGDYGAFDAAKLDTYRHMLQLNVTTLTELTGLFLEGMKQRGSGRILNVASLAGFMPGPNFAVYAASKAYVMHFTEALNYELRGSGVSATVLCPGITETGFVSRAGMASAALAQGGLMDARSVAQTGYDGMMAGSLNVVPGWKNKLSAFACMTTPSREVLLRIAGAIFRDAGKAG